jgi:menaquinone-9 beta-reductase
MTELLVIGGGLAGTGLAIPLAQAGWRVTLVEREAGPHDKVCGEFLSHEAMLYLRALGVDPVALGAVPIARVRIAGRRGDAAVGLPFAAASLSRRVLDEALLARAAAAGVTLRRGRRVVALDDGFRDGFTARLDDGTHLAAPQVALATGKHDLRGHRRPPGCQNDLVGFKRHYRLGPDQAQALAGHVELMLFADGYAGLEPIEQGLANLCLVVRRRRLAALGGTWDPLLDHVSRAVPLLGRRLAGAEAIGARTLAIATIPYGHIAPPAQPGLWRLGDQAAVVPSFSGDGMSIALHSARLAADYLLSGRSSVEFQTRLAADVGAQVRRATILSRALVHPGAQGGLLLAARMLPGLMALAARATRVPDGALLAAGEILGR